MCVYFFGGGCTKIYHGNKQTQCFFFIHNGTISKKEKSDKLADRFCPHSTVKLRKMLCRIIRIKYMEYLWWKRGWGMILYWRLYWNSIKFWQTFPQFIERQSARQNYSYTFRWKEECDLLNIEKMSTLNFSSQLFISCSAIENLYVFLRLSVRPPIKLCIFVGTCLILVFSLWLVLPI